MKKGTSIFLSLLILVAIMHLSIATHFCDGKDTGSRVSLAARLADCEMEGSENKLPLQGANFTKHCCDDVVLLLGTDSNYTPSFSFVPESFQNNFKVFAIPVSLSVNSCTDLISLYTNISPHGALMSTYVDLSDICTFRI